MTKPELNILSLSDIHLGHRKNEARFICANLDRMIKAEIAKQRVDLIILAGDVFDTLLTLPDKQVPFIDRWIKSFLRQCSREKIVVRIVEGTPSHDRLQSARFMQLAELLEIELDIAYFSDISVERIDSLGVDVLYIPDEIRSSPEETLKCVKELLAAKALDRVDFAVMHGTMDFQLRDLPRIPKHDSEAYCALVRHFVFVGHIHRHSVYKGTTGTYVIAHGSPDRVAHGEEEAKGFIRAKVTEHSADWWFIENTGARIFKTMLVEVDEPLESVYERVTAFARSCPEDSHLKVKAPSKHPILAGFAEVTRMFPMYYWTKADIQEDDESQHDSMSTIVSDEDDYDVVEITPSNIASIVKNKLEQLSGAQQSLDDAMLVLNKICMEN